VHFSGSLPYLSGVLFLRNTDADAQSKPERVSDSHAATLQWRL